MARTSRPQPKRDPGKPPVPVDELVELAAIIAEHKLDNNAKGWLSLPWRSGWNVVRLCLEIDSLPSNTLPANSRSSRSQIEVVASNQLERWLRQRVEDHHVYHDADDLRVQLGSCNRALACALRCVQVTIAKSDGGGHVFNDVIRSFIEALPVDYGLSDAILEARCWDAIGVGAMFRNDKDDRLRRAFAIAWTNGLYHAAYAIPRAH